MVLQRTGTKYLYFVTSHLWSPQTKQRITLDLSQWPELDMLGCSSKLTKVKEIMWNYSDVSPLVIYPYLLYSPLPCFSPLPLFSSSFVTHRDPLQLLSCLDLFKQNQTCHLQRERVESGTYCHWPEGPKQLPGSKLHLCQKLPRSLQLAGTTLNKVLQPSIRQTAWEPEWRAAQGTY